MSTTCSDSILFHSTYKYHDEPISSLTSESTIPFCSKCNKYHHGYENNQRLFCLCMPPCNCWCKFCERTKQAYETTEQADKRAEQSLEMIDIQNILKDNRKSDPILIDFLLNLDDSEFQTYIRTCLNIKSLLEPISLGNKPIKTGVFIADLNVLFNNTVRYRAKITSAIMNKSK